MQLAKSAGVNSIDQMKFTGKLLKPITVTTRTAGLLTSDADSLQEIEKHNRQESYRALAEQLEKIDELRSWLRLPKKSDDPVTDWALLALNLAQKFVPGFRIKNTALGKNRGRKKEWDSVKLSELIADVGLLQRERRRTDSEACQALTKVEKFKKRWGKYTSRTLRNKLIIARQPKNNLLMLIAGRARETGISEKQFNDILIDSFGITQNQ
jgi:hypothetical protein